MGVCMRSGGGKKSSILAFYSKIMKKSEKSRVRNTIMLMRYMEINFKITFFRGSSGCFNYVHEESLYKCL